jgi:hypothetical protein
MTREETLAIMGVLKAAYPNFYKGMGRADAEGIVYLWSSMFDQEPAQLVAMAVKAHIANDKNGYPPHIGAIKEAIVKLRTPEEMTEQEAWGLVLKALRNGIYGAQKEFDALPPLIQRLVGSPSQLKEWAMMDGDAVNSVVASNFQRSYKVRSASEREMLALPQDVRQAMQALGGGMAMQRLGDGGA